MYSLETMTRNFCKILYGKLLGKTLTQAIEADFKDNIKTDLKKADCEDVTWVEPAEDRVFRY
jgi:hypothetical protein